MVFVCCESELTCRMFDGNRLKTEWTQRTSSCPDWSAADGRTGCHISASRSHVAHNTSHHVASFSLWQTHQIHILIFFTWCKLSKVCLKFTQHFMETWLEASELCYWGDTKKRSSTSPDDCNRVCLSRGPPSLLCVQFCRLLDCLHDCVDNIRVKYKSEHLHRAHSD